MPRLGVCSWSLRPSGPEELVAGVRACGLGGVQLALDPLRTGAWDTARTRRALADARIAVLSGMMAMEGEDYSTLESIRATGGVRPDATWGANLEAARANADLAAGLGLTLVTFHAGFLPHDPADRERGVMLDRLRTLSGVFVARGVGVALETGQESAPTLLAVLRDLGPGVAGVNFDPANMILYGMGDPVEALRLLGPHVRQVHVKDADPSPTPGQWGTERVVGTGAVDWPRFFGTLRGVAPGVDLVIEREAGPTRAEDIRTARALVERS
ncbi:MAG: sugar phosphate isomerase/epimerase [Phycisphaerae bacterium]|nr:sugar phosphate isomerase/epimerase [Phycisphaerae bacterium]